MSKHNTMNEATAEAKSAIELVREGGSLNFDNITGYALIRCEKAVKNEDRSITVPVSYTHLTLPTNREV